MPNIRSYDSPPLDLHPTGIGAEAAAAAGRRGGAFFNEAAQDYAQTGQRIGGAVKELAPQIKAAVDKVAEGAHQVVSHAAATSADILKNVNRVWNDTVKTADPNDPSIAGQFREETLEPALQQFREAATKEGGQQFADQFADKYRQHMFEKITADMSTLAGEAASKNVRSTINSLGVAVNEDPSSLKFARESLDGSIEAVVDTSPNLSPEQAAQVKAELTADGEKHLVHSAVMGAIVKGGDWQRLANDPQNASYLDPKDIEQFGRAASVYQRVQKLTQEQSEAFKQQQGEQTAITKGTAIFTDNVSIDPGARASIKPEFFRQSLDLAATGGPVGASTARTLLDWGEFQLRQGDEPVVSNPEAISALTDRIFQTSKPLTQIDLMRAQVDGGLSNEDFASMSAIARQVADDADRPWANAIRQDVAAREPAALAEISNWLADAPKATSDEAQQRANAVVAQYDATRNSRLVATLPLPRFVGVPRERVAPDDIDSARGRTLDAALSGRMNLAEIARESALLDHWGAAVGAGER